MENKFFKDSLPFLIRPENVARYEEGKVYILDRRVYPFKKHFVECKTYEETAQAIIDMVTQSGGPAHVVTYGMVQAARRSKDKGKAAIIEELKKGAKVLGHARPTNNNIMTITKNFLALGLDAVEQGLDPEDVLRQAADDFFVSEHLKNYKLGLYAEKLIKDGDGVFNHCWAENSIIYTLLCALDAGKKLTAVCSETRPYLQGARLTSDAISELGIPTTLICDNMPGYTMSQGKIQIFFAGADRITMSGHIINKVGTFQAALCAHHFGIPFFALGYGPHENSMTDKDVEIEERNPEEILHCLGMRTATANVKGYYPAFDVTPPEFVSGIATDRGVFSPYTISDYLHAQ